MNDIEYFLIKRIFGADYMYEVLREILSETIRIGEKILFQIFKIPRDTHLYVYTLIFIFLFLYFSYNTLFRFCSQS